MKKIYNLIFIVSIFFITNSPNTRLYSMQDPQENVVIDEEDMTQYVNIHTQKERSRIRLERILTDIEYINEELTKKEKKEFYKKIQNLVELTRKSHEENKIKVIKKLGKKLAIAIGLSISTIVTIAFISLMVDEAVGPETFLISWTIISYIVYKITYGFYRLKEYIKYSFKMFIAPFRFAFKAVTLPIRSIYNLYDYLIVGDE